MIPNITMIDSGFDNCIKLDNFLKASEGLAFSGGGKKAKYAWIKNILKRLDFRSLTKKEKGIIREYLAKVTGYSSSQLTRLISKYLIKGDLNLKEYHRNKFSVKYTASDIAHLVETDNLHSRLNGVATRRILEREYQNYGHLDFKNISQISVSQIYRLRGSKRYISQSLTFKHTQAVKRNIGERRKPQPNGLPGYIRIDTVHQGDLASDQTKQTDKDQGQRIKYTKGVYHINSADEVTQTQIIAAVEQISESYLEPILKLIIDQYPFIIVEFHADNGSEYINHTVAKLLNKLLIKLTKSRPRKSNDNALIESKNGSVIRKHMGYFYINQKYAPDINDFYLKFFNNYLNFHRPCGFATIITDSKGKQKKVYDTYMTPYEALKKIKDAEKYLKPGVTLASLEKIALSHSDNEYAKIMEIEKAKLFEKIGFNPVV